jgi:formate dehydrogenase maturation protein FdhE
MPNPKNCPCCGAPPKINKVLEGNGRLYYFAGCSVCSVRAKRETKLEAIQDWNKRVSA